MRNYTTIAAFLIVAAAVMLYFSQKKGTGCACSEEKKADEIKRSPKKQLTDAEVLRTMASTCANQPLGKKVEMTKRMLDTRLVDNGLGPDPCQWVDKPHLIEGRTYNPGSTTSTGSGGGGGGGGDAGP